jgi:hypothetical protein
MAKNRRPQAPKRRNFVAKNVGKFNRPQTFRDRTKYDRYEDYLKDQLDDYVNNIEDDDVRNAKKAEFKSKLADREHDPDMSKEYEDYLDRLYSTNDFSDYDY